MGKKQHQKDKMYLTYTEWGTLFGGKKVSFFMIYERISLIS